MAKPISEPAHEPYKVAGCSTNRAQSYRLHKLRDLCDVDIISGMLCLSILYLKFGVISLIIVMISNIGLKFIIRLLGHCSLRLFVLGKQIVKAEDR